MGKMIQYVRSGIEEIMLASALLGCQTTGQKQDAPRPVEEGSWQQGIYRTTEGYQIVACVKGTGDDASRAAEQRARKSFMGYTAVLALDESSQDYRYPNFEVHQLRARPFQGITCTELIAIHHPQLEPQPVPQKVAEAEPRKPELDYKSLGRLLDRYDVH